MDVVLHHGGVDAHSASLHNVVGPRDLHDPIVDLMDRGRPHRHAPATHGLCVGHLGCTDTGEIAIHQIGADLALQYRIAPVADVLQNQQSQHHLRRETQSAAPAALGMAPHQCPVDS